MSKILDHFRWQLLDQQVKAAAIMIVEDRANFWESRDGGVVVAQDAHLVYLDRRQRQSLEGLLGLKVYQRSGRLEADHEVCANMLKLIRQEADGLLSCESSLAYASPTMRA